MSSTRYTLTDEHRARLPEYAEYGIALARRTAPQTEADRERATRAAIEMYRRANLDPPRVVFAPSPIAARFAAGFAAWIWHTVAATDDATVAATVAATDDATHAAIDLSRWYAGVGDMAALDRDLGLGSGGVRCSRAAWSLYQGGNMWAGWVAYAEFFRLVARLPIDWAPWMPWRDLAETGGFRYLHRRFVIISDFPTIHHVDDAGRGHCEDGPYMAWRDGTRLYSWHGIRVPGWVIEHPERITPALIDDEPNGEIRRVMIERYGWGRYLDDTGSRPISEAVDEGGEVMRLYASDDLRRLRLLNSTADPDGSRREYVLRVPGPEHSGDLPPGYDCDDVWHARNWVCGLAPGARFDEVS